MYSLHIRKKIMKIKKEERLSIREIARRFGISPNTVYKWGKRIEPKRWRKQRKTKIDMKELAEDVRNKPDAYQYERAKRLRVSQATVHFGLNRLGVTYKKNVTTSKSKRRKAYYVSKENRGV